MKIESRKEILESQIPDKLKKIALTAKTISLDDTRVQEHINGNIQEHRQYRNNFFVIFMDLEKYLKDGNINIYLDDLIKAGVNPNDFYNNNKELCDDLFKAFEETKEYDQLLWEGVVTFYKNGRGDLANCLDNMVPNPIGIEAVGMYAWDKINSLLEKADHILKDMGVNTEKLGL